MHGTVHAAEKKFSKPGKRRKKTGETKVSPVFYLRLRPPPRLPSMLRFRSAIFPSEEERNCLSLSSKDWSAEGASVDC